MLLEAIPFSDPRDRRWARNRGVEKALATDISAIRRWLDSRGGVVRALVDGDHFLEVSANQR